MHSYIIFKDIKYIIVCLADPSRGWTNPNLIAHKAKTYWWNAKEDAFYYRWAKAATVGAFQPT